MDESDRLFKITEDGKFNRSLTKAILVGFLGFSVFFFGSVYSCNRDDNLKTVQVEQISLAKA